MLILGSVAFATTVDLSPIEDTYVYQGSGHTTENYGNNTEIGVGSNPAPNSEYRGFFKFDLSNYSSSTITEADLYLIDQANNTGTAFYILPYQLSNGFNWTEETITWVLMPVLNASFSNYACLQDDGGTGNLCYDGAHAIPTQFIMNMTEFVNLERVLRSNNVSFALSPANVSSAIKFSSFGSKENANVNYRPFLRITYSGAGSNLPVVQEVAVPSYPSTDEPFSCWANITGSGTITANYFVFRKQTGDSVFSLVGSGTKIVTSGVLTNVGTVSDYLMTDNSQYFCMVDGTNSYGTGNHSDSSTVTSKNRATFTVLPPTSVSSGDNSTTRITATLTQSPSAYAYAECDYSSPTSVHYYPPNATGDSNYCTLLDYNSPRYIYITQQTNETGTWSLDSCALYISNYSDCRASDVSLHKLIVGIGTWQVTSAPRVSTVTVTPTTPNPNDDLLCYAKITSDQNATFQAEVRWSLNGAYLPIQMVTVSNNTNTLVSTLSHSIMQLGDNISCVVRGYDGTNYGSYYSSNVVNVVPYTIQNLNTTPEPTLLGMGKTVTFTTEIPTFTTRIYYTKPSGATGYYEKTESSTTSHNINLLSGSATADFNEIGVYYYSIKSCNCISGDMDDEHLCPLEQCVITSAYPDKDRAMTYYGSSNYYLISPTIFNTTMGRNLEIMSLFSKATNVFRAVITYPDSTQRTFRTQLLNTTDGTLFLTTGSGKDLNQTGIYSADLYGAYGSYGTETDCLDTAECQYSNYTLGIPFELTASTEGSISNVQPDSVYYGNDVNIEFDTTNGTDTTCIRFTFGEGIYGMTKYKTLSNFSLPTHWVIPTTTGDAGFLSSLADYTYYIKSCKNNGTQTCMNSLCDAQQPSRCEYCMYSDGNTLSVLDTAITNIHYNTPIGKNCEDLVVTFDVNPATTRVSLFFDSGLVGVNPIYVNETSSIATTSWTVNVPYSTLADVVCNGQTPSVCNYNNKVFWIQAFDINGNLTLQSSGNHYAINQSKTCTYEDKGGASGGNAGTGIGQIVGSAIGMNGAVGDMVFALVLSIILTVGVAILLKDANQPVIPVAVFLSCLCLFSVAGMMPLWIPLILIVIVGFIAVKGIVGTFSG